MNFAQKTLAVVSIGFLSCTFMDAALGLVTELGVDPFTSGPVDIPEGCHAHLGGELHCAPDQGPEIEW